MFQAEKLKEVRMLYGFSLSSLAEDSGIDEWKLVQYEQGRDKPNFEELLRLNKIFSISNKYFFTENYIDQIAKEKYISYRSSNSYERSNAVSEEVFLNFAHMFLCHFSSNVNLFNLKIKQLMKKIDVYISKKLTEETIAKIACIARKELNVDTNRHLISTLENNGIIIIEKKLKDDADAYSTWVDSIPYIVLGNHQKSFVRRNFDLAHELGHILLHYKMDMRCLNKAEYKQIEKQANCFAANFLLPKKEFLHDLESIKDKTNPLSYLDLKKKWFVSLQALGLRTYNLNKLSYDENRIFYSKLHKYKNLEPLDLEITIIRAGRVRSLFKFVLENKLISIKEVTVIFNIKLEFLEYIFGLQKSFFMKYINDRSYDRELIKLGFL